MPYNAVDVPPETEMMTGSIRYTSTFMVLAGSAGHPGDHGSATETGLGAVRTAVDPRGTESGAGRVVGVNAGHTFSEWRREPRCGIWVRALEQGAGQR
jgi:hypothetical protein